MAATLLAIDQGTTSTRAILFDLRGQPLAVSGRELPQYYPRDGWVEHDPEEIWRDVLATCKDVLAAPEGGTVAAIGIANQRETTVVWERATGRAIHNAIVWQDRRGADLCRRLADAGNGPGIANSTGLVIDSYFSASKLAWLLDSVPGARAAASQGALAFGTIDSYLLWRLTGGRVHRTDASNAARTMLFDIGRQIWDPDLLALFGVPAAILPEVMDNAAPFGGTDRSLFGRAIAITGMAGDQQAATIGQACFTDGMVKSTYGTGCFMLANTGDRPRVSANRLLATIAYRLGGRATYALEGSIFNAGSTVKWLSDTLGLIKTPAESEYLARGLASNRGVYLVPAFTGLGAPYWDPDARGALLGLSRDTGIAEIARAGLEAVCYQTHDLVEAMALDGVPRPAVLRVDGGMAANDWLMQFLADILGVAVERPRHIETTAAGAAFLAGLGAGLYGSLADIAATWTLERRFEPNLDAGERAGRIAGWQDAISRVRSRAVPPKSEDGP
ncbi:MAG: glycerol kinase [Alphaproteobacteria bacterium]|nr:glycerol kinase [Alphaproteobacteria bacterium]